MDRLSNAQQIKELYKELLADSQEHTRIELFAYAQQKSGGRFTDGMLTGALRTLVTDTNDYICVRRGCYKKKSTEENSKQAKYTFHIPVIRHLFRIGSRFSTAKL